MKLIFTQRNKELKKRERKRKRAKKKKKVSEEKNGKVEMSTWRGQVLSKIEQN